MKYTGFKNSWARPILSSCNGREKKEKNYSLSNLQHYIQFVGRITDYFIRKKVQKFVKKIFRGKISMALI